ncbi:MAG: disulfide bond formation protein DsbA, partial [SAR324 cluster bacterium]|nr:disulfide bond formation protein DsbA [SAR324 cluster bacterium]
DKVEFIDIPIVFRGQDDSPLRLYYVARKIGKADLIKDGERKAALYGVSGTPTVVIQNALKMDIGPYGTMADFVKKVPETIADLMQ